MEKCPNRNLKGSNNSLLSQILTPEIYNALKCMRTSTGCTIDHCIQTGLRSAKHPTLTTVGLVAGDEECYSIFSDIFNPVIIARHGGHDISLSQPRELSARKLIRGEDLDEKYVLSCRIRASRNIKGFCLLSHSNTQERSQIESIAIDALGRLDNTMKGQYQSLMDISKEDEVVLLNQGRLFSKPDSPYFVASGLASEWPKSRGLCCNAEKNFIVWVNEEDHLRIISMQKGGNLKQTFTRLCDGISQLENRIRNEGHTFMWNDNLGYLATCPCNLGTGLRVGVHIKIPFLAEHAQFDLILKRLKLQKRGPGGADTAPEGGVCDISNLFRLGSTEIQQVQLVVNGVELLIAMEKALEMGQDIENLIPQE